MLAAAALALALTACGKKEEAPPQRAALTVTTMTATPKTLPRRVEVSGSVTAWNEVAVGAETGGLTAVQVLVDEGDWVREGQLLVKMNDTLLRAELRRQQAQVESARASLVEADNALARARELKAKGFLAQASLDQRVSAQGTAAAGLSSAQASLAETSARLDQTNLRAPVSGLISARSVVKGQIVGAGTELFRLVRDGRLELAAEVPEVQLAQVKAGMPATVSGDQSAPVVGSVRVVTPQVNAQTRVGLARIALAQPGGFRPGMFAKGSIDVGDQPALTVPQTTVVYRNGKAGVFLIDKTNHARFRPVQTGVRVSHDVEIVQGLAAGDRIAVSGAGFLAEGDLVRVSGAVATAAPAAKR